MKDYEKLTKDELLEIVFMFSSESTKVKAYLVLKKQIDGIIEYLDSNTLATKQNLSDKDEKTWDRGKALLKDLSIYTRDLHELEKTFLTTEKSYIEKAKSGSLEAYLLNGEKGK